MPSHAYKHPPALDTMINQSACAVTILYQTTSVRPRSRFSDPKSECANFCIRSRNLNPCPRRYCDLGSRHVPPLVSSELIQPFYQRGARRQLWCTHPGPYQSLDVRDSHVDYSDSCVDSADSDLIVDTLTFLFPPPYLMRPLCSACYARVSAIIGKSREARPEILVLGARRVTKVWSVLGR